MLTYMYMYARRVMVSCLMSQKADVIPVDWHRLCARHKARIRY